MKENKTELRRYRRPNGHVPFSDWLGGLEAAAAGRISAYVDRMKAGNFGNSKTVGRGVSELKIEFGPGYRVYFIREERVVVILLCGGDKGSQRADIRRALEYAEDYRRRR